MNCCTSGVPFCCKNKVFLSAVKTISCTDVVSMLSDIHGFTRTLVIHLDLPSLQQYTWVHESLHSPPTPPPPKSLCNTPPWFTQFASHSHSSILQHTWVHRGCSATHPASLTTPWFIQTCSTLGFSLSLFATHCDSVSSQYTWSSLHFQHTLVLLHYNTLVYPDLQHTGVSPCLQYTVVQSVHNTPGVLFIRNTSWFFHPTTDHGSLLCSYSAVHSFCNILWFTQFTLLVHPICKTQRFTMHLSAFRFARHSGSLQ